MLAEIPDGWSTAPLGQLATRVRRKATGTPSVIAMITSTEGFVPQSEKYSRFMAGESLENYVALRRGEFAYNKGNSKTYPQGCIYRQDEWGEAAIPSVYISFRLVDDRLDSDFAAQFFAAGGLNRQLKQVITSGARSNGLLNVSVDDFFACDIPLPPHSEQKNIAAVLASVDEAIRATEAVAAQTRRVKEGLLQDLLTRGIGHTRFKQTEIGEIPEPWEVRTAQSLCSSRITYGVVKPGPHDPDGVPFVRSGDLRDGRIDLSGLRTITRRVSEQYSRTKLKGGELLVGLVGQPGATSIVPPELEGGNIARQAALLRVDAEMASTQFVRNFLDSQAGQSSMGLGIVGSVQQVINLKSLREVAIPVPPRSEQNLINEVIQAAADDIAASDRALERLAIVKAGLLQDLLTGAVRVSP